MKSWCICLLAASLLAIFPLQVSAQPSNDACENALPIGNGVFTGNLQQATSQGPNLCGPGSDQNEVWFLYTAPTDGRVAAWLRNYEQVIGLATGCPATSLNTVLCGVEGVNFDVVAGEQYLLQVRGSGGYSNGEFTLEVGPAGSISGQLVDFRGEPIPGLDVDVWDSKFDFVGRRPTDEAGRYTVPISAPGRFEVSVDGNFDYVRADYDAPECSPFCAVDVAAGEHVTGIDFQLDRYGRIAGTVTDRLTGEPVAGLRVTASFSASATTDEAGKYELRGLDPGTYTVLASDSVEGEFESDVTVGLNQLVEGIDFKIAALGSFSGRLTDARTGKPVQAYLAIWDARGSRVAGELSDYFEGTYSTGPLAPGTYYMGISEFDDGKYLRTLYEGVPCYRDECEPTDGTPIEVELDTHLTNIDLALDRGGIISGTIVDRLSGKPTTLGGARLYEDFEWVNGAIDDDSGLYEIVGIPPGEYVVWGASFFYRLSELWDDVPCNDPDTCDFQPATRIPVAIHEDVTGIDFALEPVGAVRGRVVDQATGQPFTRSRVFFVAPDGTVIGDADVDSDGRFDGRTYLNGDFYAVALGFDHFAGVFGGGECPGRLYATCDLRTGTLLSTNGSIPVNGVDFALTRMGSISGSVAGLGGETIPGTVLRLDDDQGEEVASITLEDEREFLLEGLEQGNYFLRAITNSEYQSELWNDLPCRYGLCDPLDGDPIRVQIGRTTSGVDLELTRRAEIRGTVVDSVLGAPISEVEVLVFDAAGGLERSVDTQLGTGEYSVTGLEPGTYFLGTRNNRGFFDEVHGGPPCRFACDPTLGTPVSMALNGTRQVDFQLDPQQGLGGRVRQRETGEPVADALVQLSNPSGRVVAGTRSGPNGGWVLPIALGQYFVSVVAPGSLIDQVYDTIDCFDGCDPLLGKPVDVEGNQMTLGIDFALADQQCTDGEFAHCLRDDRFRVQVSFTDFEGRHRIARAQPLTDDTGAFYFFGEDNLEIVVKVIDACSPPFNHFWVFTAGLTNLEVDIDVFDTFTGATRTYHNDLGQAFQLIRDTRAFATCDAPGAGQGAAEPPAEESVPIEIWDSFVERGAGSCTASDTQMCLQGSRFQVEATWRNANGEVGVGQAVQLTGETGYFWFFGASNVEVLLKVLDACGDPFNRFWVFAAGLTDVEVTLRVTDTVTGEVQEYANPLGSPFEPVQDTTTFATCP